MASTGGQAEFEQLMDLYHKADAAVERKYVKLGIGSLVSVPLKVGAPVCA